MRLKERTMERVKREKGKITVASKVIQNLCFLSYSSVGGGGGSKGGGHRSDQKCSNTAMKRKTPPVITFTESIR